MSMDPSMMQSRISELEFENRHLRERIKELEAKLAENDVEAILNKEKERLEQKDPPPPRDWRSLAF